MNWARGKTDGSRKKAQEGGGAKAEVVGPSKEQRDRG